MKRFHFTSFLLGSVVLASLAWVRSPKVQPEESPAPPVANPISIPPRLIQATPPSRKITSAVATPAADLAPIEKQPTQTALQKLEEQVRVNPTNPAVMSLATAYANNPRDRDKAERLFKNAIETDPENRESLENFLNLQNDPERPGAPLISLEQLVKDNPDSPNIAGALARSLGNKGQYVEAIEVLERAIDNPKADRFTFRTLSDYYRRTGQSQKSAEILEKARERGLL